LFRSTSSRLGWSLTVKWGLMIVRMGSSFVIVSVSVLFCVCLVAIKTFVSGLEPEAEGEGKVETEE